MISITVSKDGVNGTVEGCTKDLLNDTICILNAVFAALDAGVRDTFRRVLVDIIASPDSPVWKIQDGTVVSDTVKGGKEGQG
jgi:hypothetical protein